MLPPRALPSRPFLIFQAHCWDDLYWVTGPYINQISELFPLFLLVGHRFELRKLVLLLDQLLFPYLLLESLNVRTWRWYVSASRNKRCGVGGGERTARLLWNRLFSTFHLRVRIKFRLKRIVLWVAERFSSHPFWHLIWRISLERLSHWLPLWILVGCSNQTPIIFWFDQEGGICGCNSISSTLKRVISYLLLRFTLLFLLRIDTTFSTTWSWLELLRNLFKGDFSRSVNFETQKQRTAFFGPKNSWFFRYNVQNCVISHTLVHKGQIYRSWELFIDDCQLFHQVVVLILETNQIVTDFAKAIHKIGRGQVGIVDGWSEAT